MPGEHRTAAGPSTLSPQAVANLSNKTNGPSPPGVTDDTDDDGKTVVSKKKTVMDDGYEESWDPIRQRMGEMLHSKSFDLARGATIFMNILLLVYEVDSASLNGAAPAWITTVNYGLILVYTVEIALRVAVYRQQFFHSWANWVDIFIVGVDVVVESILLLMSNVDGMPSLVILRTFRLLRLGRTHRALIMFPELNIMILGIKGALRAMFWGMILLCVVVMSFGILAVQVIHPLNKEVEASGVYDGCERCGRAFETVGASALTFTQQIIAGDSWGQVCIPIIERYPAAYLFFMTVLSVVGMVLLNLILAVVIDSANQARQETDHQQAEIKEAKFLAATEKLKVFCQELDADDSGTLSLQELLVGYEEHPDFTDAMVLLDINRKDMSTVFGIMDEDHSGTVRYDEFVEELYRMKTEESHTMITFIKFYVQEIQREMREELANTRKLLNEFHESVKSLLACEEKASKERKALLTSHDEPNDSSTQPYPANGIAAKEAEPTIISPKFDFAWVQKSHDELNRLVKNMAEDVRKNSSILGAWEQRGQQPASFRGFEEIAPMPKPSQEALPLAPMVRPMVGTSTSPRAIPTAKTPSELPSSASGIGLGLRCCEGSASAANPPTRVV